MDNRRRMRMTLWLIECDERMRMSIWICRMTMRRRGHIAPAYPSTLPVQHGPDLWLQIYLLYLPTSMTLISMVFFTTSFYPIITSSTCIDSRPPPSLFDHWAIELLRLVRAEVAAYFPSHTITYHPSYLYPPTDRCTPTSPTSALLPPTTT
ncbi:hypothetical protein Tco_1499795 [Tanacetum coccineum]